MNQRSSRYLVISVASVVIFGALFGVLAWRWFPVLTHSTIYFCRDVIGYMNPYRLPDHLSMILLGLLFSVFASAIIKIVMTLVQLVSVRSVVSKTVSLSQHPQFLHILRRNDMESKVVLIHHARPLAFCFGFFRPRMYFSDTLVEMMSPQELTTILMHEKHHMDTHDNLTMFFAQLAEILFPFVPVFGEFTRNFRIEREVAADQFAIQYTGERALISSLSKLLSADCFENPAFLPAFSAQSTLESRVRALTQKKYRAGYSWQRAILSFFSLIILCISAFIPLHSYQAAASGGSGDAVLACVRAQHCAAPRLQSVEVER